MRRLQYLPSIQELALEDAQVLADEFHIPIVWVDHQATRRQRLHGANLPDRENAYTSTHMNEILDHLAHEGYDAAILICEKPNGEHLACQIDFMPLPDEDSPRKP